MQQKIEDRIIFVKPTKEEEAIIKNWRMMKKDKKKEYWYGEISRPLLENLQRNGGLIPPARKILNDMLAVQKAVDTERVKPDKEIKPRYKYPVKAKLFTHQIRAANMALMIFGILPPEEWSRRNGENSESISGLMASQNGKGFGLLFEMGCGKTITAITIAGAAYQKCAIQRVLVIAPTSVVSVWPKEIAEVADFKVTCKALLGTKQQRIRIIEDLQAFPLKALKVAVINYESTWRDGLFEKLQEYDADLVICDESQRIKTHDAEQSKAIHKLGDQARYKLILSGTPVQNNAIDLYSQYRFLDPTIFGTNFYQFRNRYAIMGGFNRHKIVGYRNLDQLIQKEHSIAYRVTKDEALDLPEQTFLERRITLTQKEKNIYNKIKRESFAELDGGGKVTVTTVLTKLLRLQQFTGGFLVADGSEKAELVSKGKLNALEEIIEDYVVDVGKKLVIFARFRAEIDLIGQMLKKKKIRYGEIYGDVKLEDRGDIVKDFQTNEDTKIFLAQIDTAGLGITLTAADTCVYYSVNFNYAAYSQSLARIHRIGQKNACTYIHLITEGTVDETILKALAKKKDLAKTIVDEWRNYF